MKQLNWHLDRGQVSGMRHAADSSCSRIERDAGELKLEGEVIYHCVIVRSIVHVETHNLNRNEIGQVV